jgi:hypothetical protein
MNNSNWTSVKEKQPETAGEYLATVKLDRKNLDLGPITFVGIFTYLVKEDCNIYLNPRTKGWQVPQNIEVLAWQEKPELYEEQEPIDINILNWITDFNIFDKSKEEIVKYLGNLIKENNDETINTYSFNWANNCFTSNFVFENNKLDSIFLYPKIKISPNEVELFFKENMEKIAQIQKYFETENIPTLHDANISWKINKDIIFIAPQLHSKSFTVVIREEAKK